MNVSDPGIATGSANLGGPTEVIALLAGSEAIGAGSVALADEYGLTTDQRGAGFPRIVSGMVDIGAFESPVFGEPTVYTVNLTSDTGSSSGIDATTGTLSGDLLWAINQANGNINPAGSVIEFDPTVFNSSSPQTIVLTSTLELAETPWPEVIEGPGADALTVSGNNAVQVFVVDPGTTATIAGLTISGGSGARPGINNDGTLTVAGCTIADNSNGDGAGIFNNGTGLTVTDSVIEDNSGDGAVYNTSVWPITLTDCTIEGNRFGIVNYGDMTVANCTISYNSRDGFVLYGGSITLTDSTVAENSGAAIDDARSFSVSEIALTVTNCTIADNAGGIYVHSGVLSLTLDNSIVALNTDGGAFADLDVAVPSVVAYNNLVGVDETGILENGVNGNQVGVAPQTWDLSRWRTTAGRPRPWPCRPAARRSMREVWRWPSMRTATRS